MAFLDFGNVKVVDPEWRAGSHRLVRAVVERDEEEFMNGLVALGYVHRAERAGARRLIEQTLEAGDWFLRDKETRIDPAYVGRIIAQLADPRSIQASLRLARGLKVPPEEI